MYTTSVHTPRFLPPGIRCQKRWNATPYIQPMALIAVMLTIAITPSYTLPYRISQHASVPTMLPK